MCALIAVTRGATEQIGGLLRPDRLAFYLWALMRDHVTELTIKSFIIKALYRCIGGESGIRAEDCERSEQAEA